MAETNAVNRFRVPKSIEEESKLLKESFPKSTISVVFFCILFFICISCYQIQGSQSFCKSFIRNLRGP